MKIAFWSEEKKAGTTFNMAVIACASVLMYPLSIAVVSGSYHDEDLEKKFLGNEEELSKGSRQGQGYQGVADFLLAEEPQEYFLTSGLDCLLGKENREDLTEQVVKANMRQVIENRMYCMPGSRKENQEWWYQDRRFTRMNQVMDAVEACFDVVFVDCGSRKDDFAQKMLREAEVCVLNMDQESELIGDYYRNPPEFRGKTFFLVGNYFKDALYTRRNLERIYRVEENVLGAIPYNPQLQAESQAGRTEGGVKRYIGRNMKGKNVEFEQELMRTTRLILKQAGVIE